MEIANVATDPRDVNRSTGVAAYSEFVTSSNNNSSSSGSSGVTTTGSNSLMNDNLNLQEAEEFPALPSDNRPGGAGLNKNIWGNKVKVGSSSNKQNQDFPSLSKSNSTRMSGKLSAASSGKLPPSGNRKITSDYPNLSTSSSSNSSSGSSSSAYNNINFKAAINDETSQSLAVQIHL